MGDKVPRWLEIEERGVARGAHCTGRGTNHFKEGQANTRDGGGNLPPTDYLEYMLET